MIKPRYWNTIGAENDRLASAVIQAMEYIGSANEDLWFLQHDKVLLHRQTERRLIETAIGAKDGG